MAVYGKEIVRNMCRYTDMNHCMVQYQQSVYSIQLPVLRMSGSHSPQDGAGARRQQHGGDQGGEDG